MKDGAERTCRTCRWFTPRRRVRGVWYEPRCERWGCEAAPDGAQSCWEPVGDAAPLFQED